MRDTDWLDDVMDDGHVILVRADGTVDTDPRRTWDHVPHAPEDSRVFTTWRDGSILAEHEIEWTGRMHASGWTPERGWSSAYLYRGPFMDAGCESVGSSLERHILETPGLWAVIYVYCDRSDPEPGEIRCAHCGTAIEEIAGNWEDPDGEWEDPAAEGGPVGRQHCPDASDDRHAPEKPEEEDDDTPAGWAILHYDLDENITRLEEAQAQALWVSDQDPAEGHEGPGIEAWERAGHGETLDQLRAMTVAAGITQPCTVDPCCGQVWPHTGRHDTTRKS